MKPSDNRSYRKDDKSSGNRPGNPQKQRRESDNEPDSVQAPSRRDRMRRAIEVSAWLAAAIACLMATNVSGQTVPAEAQPSTPPRRPEVAPPVTPLNPNSNPGTPGTVPPSAPRPATPGTTVIPARPATPATPAAPGTPSAAATPAGQRMPETEAEFLSMIGTAGMADLRLVQLAAERSQNPQIKAWAQEWLQAYQTNAPALTELNRSFGVTLPDTADAVAQETFERLSAMEGAAFDNAFLRVMQSSSATGISRFEAANRFSTSQGLRNYLNTSLPALRTSGQQLQRLGGPNTRPQATPGATPTPGTVPGTTPGTTPTTPGTAPGTTPGTTPTTPGTAPGTTPTTPGTAPGTTPTTPGTTPGTTPTTPGTAPGTTPTTPGTAPGTRPGASPGTAPGTSPGTSPGSTTGPSTSPPRR